jgi:ribosomal protein S18 acetylase RimI-like enzyme
MGSPSVRIRRAGRSDAPAIAAIHREQIPWGLLSRLGGEFVTAFYGALVESPLGFGFVAEADGRVVGFATGVVDWRRFYREFLRRHLRLAVRAFAADLRGGRWRRLLETTRYAASGALPPAELVSIAVSPEARGGGVAAGLVTRVLREFSERAVAAVRVTAGTDNAPARRLYERAGFTLHSEAEIHRGEFAAIYVTVVAQERSLAASAGDAR